jgi:hypothetical protein
MRHAAELPRSDDHMAQASDQDRPYLPGKQAPSSNHIQPGTPPQAARIQTQPSDQAKAINALGVTTAAYHSLLNTRTSGMGILT